MENSFKQMLDIEINKVLEFVKSKSSTFGEAKKLLSDLDYEAKEKHQAFIVSEAKRILNEEIDKTIIKKEPSGSLTQN